MPKVHQFSFHSFLSTLFFYLYIYNFYVDLKHRLQPTGVCVYEHIYKHICHISKGCDSAFQKQLLFISAICRLHIWELGMQGITSVFVKKFKNSVSKCFNSSLSSSLFSFGSMVNCYSTAVIKICSLSPKCHKCCDQHTKSLLDV